MNDQHKSSATSPSALLAWHVPLAISTPAPGYGEQVEIIPAEKAQPFIRDKILHDLYADAAITAGFSVVAGVVWVLAAGGSFWSRWSVVLGVTIGTKLLLHGVDSFADWLKVPNCKSGSVEIYTDRILYEGSDGSRHCWPAKSIRQIRLSVEKSRKGERRLFSIRFARANWQHILVPESVTFDAIERAATSAHIPVSRPRR